MYCVLRERLNVLYDKFWRKTVISLLSVDYNNKRYWYCCVSEHSDLVYKNETNKSAVAPVTINSLLSINHVDQSFVFSQHTVQRQLRGPCLHYRSLFFCTWFSSVHTGLKFPPYQYIFSPKWWVRSYFLISYSHKHKSYPQSSNCHKVFL